MRISLGIVKQRTRWELSHLTLFLSNYHCSQELKFFCTKALSTSWSAVCYPDSHPAGPLILWNKIFLHVRSSKFQKQQQPMKNRGNLGAQDSWNEGLAIHVMPPASNHRQQMYFDTKSSFFTFRCINCLRRGFLPHTYFLSSLIRGILPPREQNRFTAYWGHRTTPAILEAKQSPSCHHLSLTSVEADLKRADIKAVSNKTDPLLLQKLHRKRQGQAVNSPQIFWKNFVRGTELYWNGSDARRLLSCPHPLETGV